MIDPLKVPAGLGILAVKILIALQHGGANGTVLAERTQSSVATISQGAWRLEQKGLIARRRSLKDRRKFFFQLTSEGRRLVDSLRPTEANRPA